MLLLPVAVTAEAAAAQALKQMALLRTPEGRDAASTLLVGLQPDAEMVAAWCHPLSDVTRAPIARV
jgi:hypothetical protein